MGFGDLLNTVMARRDLTADQARQAMDEIVEGRARPAQVAGFLVGLAMKGERPAEIVGFARAMRARAVRLPSAPSGCVDLCGTGGDHSGTFNISSAAALVVAACGVPVAKHGNRSVSSRCGSADVFETLGVDVAAPPETVDACLRNVGMAFLFAPTFHPSMRAVGEVRRELAVRTAFNLLGPLTNPVAPPHQLVGVPRPELTEPIARALALLGSERAWVVHGADGLDEISTTGHTKVSECRGGTVNTFYLHPAEAGIAKVAREALAGGDAVANAAIIRQVLNGTPGPARDVVLLNAGAMLFLAGRAPTLRDGIAMGGAVLDNGSATRVLAALASASHGDGA